MDKIIKDNVSLPSESELTSPLPPKRLKTDWTVATELSGKSPSSSSEPWTFQKSCLSSSNLQNPESLTSTADCGHYQHENPQEKPQEETVKVTHLATLHPSDIDKESNEVCLDSVEQDEKPSLTETDRVNPCLRGDTDRSPPPTNNNTFSVPNSEQLGKSYEDETPGCFSVSTGNEKDGTQSDVSQLQAVPFCSSQPGFSCEDAEQHTALCYTDSQLAALMKTFSNSVPLSKAGDTSPISSKDLADPHLLYLHPEEDLSGIMAEDGKNEKQKPELQNCTNENLSLCDIKTKVHGNDSSETHCCFAGCAEGSNLPHAVALDTSTAAENVSFEVDNYIGADHSAETSKFSQEPAEGDNDSDAFSVIDPAICSEIDAEVEGMLCNSEDSTAGRELSPSVEIALPLCSTVRTSQTEETTHRGTTQLGKDENQIRCQSHTEPQAYSVTSKNTQDKSDRKADCQFSPSSSPAIPAPPAEVGGKRQSPDPVGHQLSLFAVSPDHVKTQEVEYSQNQTDRGAKAAEIQGKELAQFLKQKQTDEHESLVPPMKASETSPWMGDGTLKCTDGEQRNKPDSLNDKPDIYVMGGMTEGEEEGEGINVGKERNPGECENSEIWKISWNSKKNPTSMSSDEKQESNVREESPDRSLSEFVEGSRFTDDSEQRLGCFSQYQLSSDIFFIFPSGNDAVVPCQPNLGHSDNSQSSSTAIKCSNRFPPSALALHNHVLGGFDTFEKIRLLPNYEDDAGFLISLSEEMLKTPQQQLQHDTAKTELNIHKSVEEKEEEVKGTECHTENITNAFVSCDSSHIDASNSISAADVIEPACPEQQPDCGSGSDSSEEPHNESSLQSESSATPPESDSPPSDLNHSIQFEMKEHFDRVLKELTLFFEISRDDFAGDCVPKSPEQCNNAPEPAKETSEHLSSPELGHHRETSTGMYFLCFENLTVIMFRPNNYLKFLYLYS